MFIRLQVRFVDELLPPDLLSLQMTQSLNLLGAQLAKFVAPGVDCSLGDTVPFFATSLIDVQRASRRIFTIWLSVKSNLFMVTVRTTMRRRRM
jgi:hypothetical protein